VGGGLYFTLDPEGQVGQQVPPYNEIAAPEPNGRHIITPFAAPEKY